MDCGIEIPGDIVKLIGNAYIGMLYREDREFIFRSNRKLVSLSMQVNEVIRIAAAANHLLGAVWRMQPVIARIREAEGRWHWYRRNGGKVRIADFNHIRLISRSFASLGFYEVVFRINRRLPGAAWTRGILHPRASHCVYYHTWVHLTVALAVVNGRPTDVFVARNINPDRVNVHPLYVAYFRMLVSAKTYPDINVRPRNRKIVHVRIADTIVDI